MQSGLLREANPYDVATAYELHTTAVTGIVEWSSDPFGVKSITDYRDQSSFNRSNIAGGDSGA